MATAKVPIFDRVGMARLQSPNARLEKPDGLMGREFREFTMRDNMRDMAGVAWAQNQVGLEARHA
jgi:hypothetical protein